MTRLPTVSVAGVLFSEDRSSVLLIQRRDVPVWVLPGGGVEAGEDPIKAIEREMYEETGFIVSADRLVGDYSPINRLAKQTQLFECTIKSQENLLDNPECRALQFFPLNKLPKHIPPPYRDWVADAYEQRPPVSKKLSQVNYARFVWYLVSHPILVIRFLLARLGKPINT
ncbi:MAG: NUDIX hydrolase [Chlamydiales bacterium]|nr:NUDIX hydrolase [Chlamydiales bacterium]